MSTLTVEQLAAWMQKAGPHGNIDLGVQVYETGEIKVLRPEAKAAAIKWLDTAIAICMSESNLNTTAANSSSNARGLWQIMTTVHAKEIEFQSNYWQSELGLSRKPNIFHPAVNCGVANTLYNQSGWKPWEAYNTGAYKRHLGKGYGLRAWKILSGVGLTQKERLAAIQKLRDEHESAVATGQLAGMLVPGGPLIGNVDAAINDPWGWIAPFLKDAGVTIGVFVLGVVLLVLGVWFLMSQTSVGTTVKGAIKKAVPVA